MQWRLVVVTEVLFLVALGFWAFVRSYSPEITTAGGEKFMELTFLNGILRSDRFPPLDPWLSGYAISYYYFGYIMLAALTQLSGLAPSVAFNVGLATWFALTLTTAFGVTFDLVAALVRSPSVRGPLEQARQRADSGAALAGVGFSAAEHRAAAPYPRRSCPARSVRTGPTGQGPLRSARSRATIPTG